MCNVNCGYNKNGICCRTEIAISALAQGGCIMYAREQGKFQEKHKNLINEDPTALR